MNYSKLILTLIWILIFCTNSKAQVENYKLYNITSSEGLLSDFVDDVYQDSYGFLWIVNFEGLTRWDGHNYVRYQHSEKDSTTLSYNIVYCVFEDSQRRLWIGTIGGLNLYDRKNDCFINCTIHSDWARVPVNAIREDSKHRLWLGTSIGLCQYNYKKNKGEWFFNNQKDLNSISDDLIFGMDIDQHDNLWLATFRGGVNKFSINTKSVTRFIHQENNAATICNNKTKSIKVDHEGNIWIGSFDEGITLLSNGGKVLEHYKQFGSNTIFRIYEDKNHTIWAGVSDDYVMYLDRKNNRFVPFTNLPYQKYHIACRSVSSMCEDNFGNLWFGSHSNGIFYTNLNKNIFHYYHKAYSKGLGIRHDLALCFHEDKTNKVWIGTEGGGLSCFDPLKNSFNTYTKADGLSSNTVADVKEDTQGNIWLATFGGGLIQFDRANKKSKVYLHDPHNPNSLLYNSIKFILPDDTLLWLGTYGEGLVVYDRKNKKFIDKTNNHILPIDLCAPAWINHMYKDSKGRLWIGTYGGLYVYDGKTMRKFLHSADTSSLINHDINMIAEDKKGRIWVITESGGLELYNEKKSSFIHYSESFHLPMIIKAVVVDNHGKLWLSSNEGLFVFDPESKSTVHYETSDGLQGNFFIQKSVMKSRNGTLYFGGNNGFNTFDPDQIKRSNVPANFYFTELTIFDSPQKPGMKDSPLQQVMLFTDEIKLSYRQSFFTVGFADINLYAPDKTQFAYKLEGLYDKWINIQSERKVSFTNLDPGTYVLKVKYTTLNGTWKEADKALTIIIFPPWWKTWWFRILFVLAILGSIVLYFYLRLSSVRRRNKQLEEEVKKRTNEITEANSYLLERNEEIKLQKENLEVYNEEIVRQSEKILIQQELIVGQNQKLEETVKELEANSAAKDRFFSILAHDLRNPAAAIKGLSDLFINRIEQLKHTDLTDFVKVVHKSSNNLYNLLVSLLDWAYTQSRNFSFSPSEFSLHDLVLKNIQLLEQQCVNKNISITVDINPSHFVHGDYNMIDTVVRNLLSNSVKFTPSYGNINIRTEAINISMVLEIRDTGLGMSEEVLKNIFKIDKSNNSKGTEGETGTGLGLIISKEFLEVNKGIIEIESQEGKGSLFRIILPETAHAFTSENKLTKEAPVIEAPTNNVEVISFSEEKIGKIKGRRALIVDDSAELRTQLRLLLSGTLEIFEAENGLEGIEKAIEYQPSVIISDMLMPVMDGLEFCRKIKTTTATSHIPVLLLTGQTDDASHLSSYEAGADVYMTKPVKQEILFQVIYNFIIKQENSNLKIADSDQVYPKNLSINKLDEEFLISVIRLIEDNISNHDLDFQVICHHTGLSRTVLYAKFKTLTGQGVHDFIKSIRLKKSIELLREGRLNVSEIAYEVGFNSPSYYIRCFTKQYGMAPKEYSRN